MTSNDDIAINRTIKRDRNYMHISYTNIDRICSITSTITRGMNSNRVRRVCVMILV